MLDSETKRRIDTCRDILVGKVPDPKSQVEQITVALIYKFMDDMDLQSEEMGGKRKFFTGDFERYRWAKLVAPGVSGQDMLNTYSEALTKMVENEKLPALFRSIFRNAYLPYRDPETLRSFLREINAFTYDHSEKLGDAFEYLLSVLGSQGDAGQFRTPRHIIDFMVDIIAPKKDEVILDPACGTAGFLISAYKHILKANSTNFVPEHGKVEGMDAAELALESPMRFSGDLLSAKDRERLARNIRGYDISPDMVRLSLVNLYLHGFADPKVEEYDTLTSEDKWTEMADVILANPPFMSPKGGIKPHTRFKVESKRSEVLFVDYMAEHLTPNGRAAIVVPEGIIFQGQSAYVQLRKMLVENFLAAVISLPAGVFNPYSGVKTSILILDRVAAKASDHIAFFKIENDGFALGAQRRAVKGDQLPQVKAELSDWLELARTGGGEALESPVGITIPRKQIGATGEFNLSVERHRVSATTQTAWPMVALGKSGVLIMTGPFGTALHESDYVTSGIPIINPKNIVAGRVSVDGIKQVSPETIIALKEFVVRSGDLIIGRRGEMGRCAVIADDMDGWLCGTGCFVIRQHHAFDPGYLRLLLSSEKVRLFLDENAVGVTMKNLNQSILASVIVPLPPLEVQREIVTEIEGYQKVIDGARAVIDNYRPHIHIDPEWPTEQIGNLSTLIQYGISEPLARGVGFKTFRMNELVLGRCVDDGTMKSVDIDRSTFEKYKLSRGDILFNRTNSFEHVGRTGIFDLNGEYCFASYLIRVAVDAAKANPFYVNACMNTEVFQRGIKQFASQAIGQANINAKSLGAYRIPLPPLEDQGSIVAELDAERVIIDANRELIARFQRKVATAIARVWIETKADAEAA